MPPSHAPQPTPASRIAARRDYKGPVFFSHGFRPFFLAAGTWSVIAILLWLGSWLGYIPARPGFDSAWHAHEMLFGFVAAAIGGFILTAIPNWTGRLPVRGFGLAGLATIWLAGRVVMLRADALGTLPTAIIDSAFLVMLALVIWREIIAGRNWRNSGPALLITLLAASNVLFHWTTFSTAIDTATAERLSLMIIIMLISLIGGRVIPSFTRNTLAKNGATKLPTPMNRFDLFVIAGTVITGVSWVLTPEARWTGALAVLMAVLHIWRLARWQGLAVLNTPMLWVLHLGYAWIGIGFALLGVHVLTGIVPISAAIHAFTAGAMGTMILAIMTRATLGHNGLPLRAGPATTLIYLSISFAVGFRITASILGTTLFYYLSGGLWLFAFTLFISAYWKPLTRNMRQAH